MTDAEYQTIADKYETLVRKTRRGREGTDAQREAIAAFEAADALFGRAPVGRAQNAERDAALAAAGVKLAEALA